jgi:hypothetical protein
MGKLSIHKLVYGVLVCVGILCFPLKLKAACVVPGDAMPKKEPIFDIGTCGPRGPKDPTWGSFGKRPDGVLIADSGETLEVECSGSGEIPLFKLWYTSPEGDRYRVGICPFGGAAIPSGFGMLETMTTTTHPIALCEPGGFLRITANIMIDIPIPGPRSENPTISI